MPWSEISVSLNNKMIVSAFLKRAKKDLFKNIFNEVQGIFGIINT